MSWCNCEDYPCCGHDGEMGPESARDFLEEMDEDEREFTLSYMRPCPNCGEMRPKDDKSMRENGCCYMCSQDPVRGKSPIAQDNLTYFRNKDVKRVAYLEKLLRQRGIEFDAEENDEETYDD